jgi:hypothetical protein
MSEAADVLLPTASQSLATVYLLPSVVGWCIQVFLSGIATCLGLLHLRSRRAGTSCPRALSSSGPLLRLALLANFLATAFTAWEICDYVTSQKRSSDELGSYKMSDIAAVYPTVLVGCVHCATLSTIYQASDITPSLLTQTFMAHRCWHITGRYLWFAIAIACLLVIALGGGILFATAQSKHPGLHCRWMPVSLTYVRCSFRISRQDQLRTFRNTFAGLAME